MPDGSHNDVATDSPLTLVTLGATALRAEVAPNHTAPSWHRGARVSGGVAGTVDRSASSASVTLFDLGKPLAVITYLCCAPERSVARDHLIDLLWGDVEPDAAKHALRQTLWYIRKRLGDRTLISGGDVLTVVGAVDSDRDAFLAAVAANDVDAVVQLYTGDFFPGFAAPGGAEFERWADIERQRLRSFFWRSAEALVRRWMSSGRLREAQTLARRVRDSDVLREGGWRLVFETIIAAGDTVGGALEGDAFDRLVAAEGIAPEPGTRAMLKAVRQARVETSEPGYEERASLVAELVGREQEFAQLLASWEAARVGKATHVHVLAPAGFGKTRLLTDAHARLRATRARTIFVRASFGARDIPFGLAGDLAEALARLSGASGISTGSTRALVALNPALSASYPAALPDATGDSADTLRRRALAVRELISAVAEEQPIAIFVDDVQWADARSRQLIASVLGALERARVLAVTASRPTVDGLVSAEQSLTLRLAPLDSAAVGALVASIAELPSEPWAERMPAELCNATGGSPLLVLETLQLAIEGGTLERGPAGWRAPRPSRLFAALGAGGALRQRVERLDPVEQWVMTLLAVAAVPLTRDAITLASGRSADETADALGSLERRGLASRHDELWSPSHDEIAAMAVELATPDARSVAARSLGRVILYRQSGDSRDLRQAGALLSRAGDHERLAMAFTRFARLARETGDRQPNRSLAIDFLGERSTPALVSRLVRSLPLVHRVGLYSGRRQATIAAMVAIVPLGFLANALVVRRPPPDIELAIGAVEPDGVAQVYRVPIYAAELAAGSTIRISASRPAWTFRADPAFGSLVRNPDPDRPSWALERISQDSGGIDIYQVSDDGTERRLTNAHGDDQTPTWSPDGRFVAYLTGRWSAASKYGIAVQDMQTGVVRRLTGSDDYSDTAPYWSPDGSRIAFARFYWRDRRREVCAAGLDGSAVRCFSNPSGDTQAPTGWYDATQVLIDASGGTHHTLMRVDLESAAVDTVAVLNRGGLWTSADGRWAVCQCRHVGFGADAMMLFPINEPNRIVELDISALGARRHLMVSWLSGRHGGQWANGLTISSGVGNPVVGVPHLLVATGVSADGHVVPIGPVRWRSLDSAVAVIDDAGLLVPKATGAVRIEAALAGWRAARRVLTVGSTDGRVLLHEDWTKGIGPPWVAYGDPRPRIDTMTNGVPAFLNGGEGSFVSGAYTSRYPTASGLTLDGWISIPITSDHWQTTAIEFDGALDDAALQRWGHIYGTPPRRDPLAPACGVAYPASGEGATYGDSVGGTTGDPSPATQVAAPPAFRLGVPFEIRVQIFPDGRCGIAVNGAAVGLSKTRSMLDATVRVNVFGNTAGTRVLVGPLTLRSGIAPGVDWSRVSATVPNAPPSGQALMAGWRAPRAEQRP